MTNQQRERAIEAAKRRMVAACDAVEKRKWWLEMRTLINAREAIRIQEMESEWLT